MTLTIGARSQYVMAVMAETVSALFQTRPLLTRNKRTGNCEERIGLAFSASAKKDFNWEASITLEDSLADIRDGLKNNLHRTVRGVSASTVGTLCPSKQEKQLTDDRAGIRHAGLQG